MEHAIIINRIEDFKNIKPKYTRVYFGNEFCPRLLPDITEIEKAVKITQESGRRFSLLTSYVGNDEMGKVKKIIRYLIRSYSLEEVIVNDLGVFNYIKENFPRCLIVFGRALSRIVSPCDFIMKMGVSRFEFDCSLPKLKNIYRENPAAKISFYYPVKVLQTTRYCAMANLGDLRINRGIIKCSKDCLKVGALKLQNDLFMPSIVLKGNTQFAKLKKDYWETLALKNADRLVFQP